MLVFRRVIKPRTFIRYFSSEAHNVCQLFNEKRYNEIRNKIHISPQVERQCAEQANRTNELCEKRPDHYSNINNLCKKHIKKNNKCLAKYNHDLKSFPDDKIWCSALFLSSIMFHHICPPFFTFSITISILCAVVIYAKHYNLKNSIILLTEKNKKIIDIMNVNKKK